MVRILHAALHTQNPKQWQAMRLIQKLSPMSVEMTEMSRTKDQQIMHHVLGNDYYTFQHQGGHGIFSRDISIALKRHKLIIPQGQDVEQSSKQVGLRGIGMPRFQRTRRWAYRGQEYAHIGIHWNAAIQNRKTGAPLNNSRRRAMVNAGKQLDSAIKGLKDEGRIVFVSGDPNWRNDLPKSDSWEWSPHNILENNNMAYRASGLDLLGWQKNMFKEVNVKVIPREKNFGDHEWLLGRFTE